MARRWLIKYKMVEEAANLIAEDAIVKSMPRQLLTHVGDRKTDTKESVTVADDFLSVRSWNYDFVQKIDQPATELTDEIGAMDILTMTNLETTPRIIILVVLAQKKTRQAAAGNNSRSLIGRSLIGWADPTV